MESTARDILKRNFQRTRRGILSEQGQSREVDITDVGLLEKRNLLERLVKIAEEDNEKFLLKLKQRIDRVGLDFPRIEVRFDQLSVDAETYVGNRGVPTIFNFTVNILEGFLNSLHSLPNTKRSLPILHEISGIVKPGRYWDLTSVLIPSLEMKCFKAFQMDSKSELLQVRAKPDDPEPSYRETTVGPAKALFTDEISTVLDSSTIFQTMNSIRQSIHILQGTTMILLLQPARETYNLVGDIVLSDGQIAYQGPHENILGFFEYMGFKCPERKGEADFLLEVTSRKEQKQYWANRDEPYKFITLREFSDKFQSFHIGQKLGDELGVPFDKSKSHPAALTTQSYGVSKKELLKACSAREFLLMKRNSFVYIQDSTTYHNGFHNNDTIPTNGAAQEYSKGWGTCPQYYEASSLYKQRDFLFFLGWAYALPTWILKIPITLVEVCIWVCMTHYC
ncbi:hypothetical protein KY284_026993 [Solanum tuberosum]|nr:hypothetical protein KY284_026993 [Solanum tuberosum]